ncbi:MAG: glycosyltransferase family 4 protein [Coriobacteriia bacterium]|nr:glycosyltransferase family 4 protein [Coriobacteriia bacterium]
MKKAEGTIQYSVFFFADDFLGLFAQERSDWTIGGAEIQTYYLAQAFARMPDVEVILLHTQSTPPPIDTQAITLRQIANPIKRGVPLLSRFLNAGRSQRNFAHSGKRAFFLVSNNEPFQLVEEAHSTGVTVFYRINGDSLVDGSPFISPARQETIDRYLSQADVLIVQNSTQARAVAERYKRDSFIVESAFCPSVAAHTTPNLDSAYPNSCLWIGRVDPIKRPWLVDELSRRLSQLHFVCVFHQRNFSELHQGVLYDLSQRPNVTLFESLSPGEVTGLYSQVDLVINTSASEGVPNTLIEAAYAQKPFVSLEVDPCEILSKTIAGTCAEGSIDLMVQHIEELIGNDSLRKDIGARAYEYAKEHWDADKTAQTLLNVL